MSEEIKQPFRGLANEYTSEPPEPMHHARQRWNDEYWKNYWERRTAKAEAQLKIAMEVLEAYYCPTNQEALRKINALETEGK